MCSSDLLAFTLKIADAAAEKNDAPDRELGTPRPRRLGKNRQGSGEQEKRRTDSKSLVFHGLISEGVTGSKVIVFTLPVAEKGSLVTETLLFTRRTTRQTDWPSLTDRSHFR